MLFHRLTFQALARTIVLLFTLSIVYACNNNNIPEDYLANKHFTAEESTALLLKLIPYSAKLPGGYDYTRRFDTALDSFYIKEVKNYELERYFFSEKDSSYYFLISRVAPSLFEKRIGIAGKYKQNQEGNITNYEEAFWTFKMKLPELEQKSLILFSEYLKGNDLSKYYPEGGQPEEWIEFPDKHSSYNKEEQRWMFSHETIN